MWRQGSPSDAATGLAGGRHSNRSRHQQLPWTLSGVSLAPRAQEATQRTYKHSRLSNARAESAPSCRATGVAQARRPRRRAAGPRRAYPAAGASLRRAAYDGMTCSLMGSTTVHNDDGTRGPPTRRKLARAGKLALQGARRRDAAQGPCAPAPTRYQALMLMACATALNSPLAEAPHAEARASWRHLAGRRVSPGTRARVLRVDR